MAKAAAAISKTPQYSWYRSKRMELDGSVKKELALARWCELEGMKDRSQFHYARVFYHPDLDVNIAKDVIKKLDLVAYEDQLRTPEEVSELEREAAANASAWRTWEKKFGEWRKAFEGNKQARRIHAHEQLNDIEDVHVTSLVEAHLADANELWSQELVNLLVRFPQPPSTTAIARAAVLSPYGSVRNAAITELKKRKLHDYIPLLLAGLSPLTKSQFLVQVRPDLSVDYQYAAVAEDGQKKSIVSARATQQTIVTSVIPWRTRRPNDPKTILIRGAAEADAKATATNALNQAMENERKVAIQNQLAKVNNENFFVALKGTTGQAIADNPSEWSKWWKEHNEVTFETPTFYLFSQYTVPVYRPFFQPTISCFIAGTPVYTESGPQPIESVRPGDRVLSQDPDTGEITFKLVQNVTVRPPSKLRKLTLGDSEVVTTLGHPFWVNGSGWKMAKELAPQQNLHTLTGAAPIVKVEELPNPDRAYNLVVADYNTYFVGSANVLVHDNLYRQPTLARVPGLVDPGR